MNIEIALAKISDQVYSDKDIFNAQQNAYGNVYEVNGVKTVAIRGSKATVFVDWTTDLNFWPEKDAVLGRCHRGFLNAADEILYQLLMIVGKDQYYLTGHSLGGALAALLAAKMTYYGRPPAYLSTFGCPNITIDNKIPEILQNIPGTRWRNGNDFVTTIPWFFKSYQPVTRIGHKYRNLIKAHDSANYVNSLEEYYSSYNG